MQTAITAPITLFTDHEVARITGTARSTLVKMRIQGNGPPWVRVGTSVRYPEADLREWIANLPRRRSTQDVSALPHDRAGESQ